MDVNRRLPSATDSEQAILSILLMHGEYVADCAQNLKPEHFHSPANSEIYAAILNLRTENKAVDFIGVTQLLSDSGRLESVGGAYFVTSLIAFGAVPSSLRSYMDAVIEKWIARKAIEICSNTVSECYEALDEPAQLVSRLIARATALLDSNTTHDPDEQTMKERVLDFQDHLQTLYERGDLITGLPFGVKSFDEHTGGIQPGEMWVICGHTKSGKSALGVQALLTCAQQGTPCSLVSLEMTGRQLVGRLVSAIGRINGGLFRKPKLFSERDFQAIEIGQTAASKLPLRIHENKRTLGRAVAAIERDVRKFGTKLACIDYAQLVDGERGRDENREREVARISATAKQIAVRNNIAVLLLSQTNDDGKLRESRAIGQDADAVIKVLVPIKEGTKPPEPDLASDRRTIVIEYARSFEPKSFPVTFINPQTRFEDHPARHAETAQPAMQPIATRRYRANHRPQSPKRVLYHRAKPYCDSSL